ncbi:transcriptional regulator family: Fungal Specific TF [Penicillium subrubescens]|uniref:transcriptional regulator family: Fungal Specific TF n=1 Tax=Penicillium subrubescens TaxID=1316194 RepID=UPI0025456642|nr:transcriptional regulator family: Fungal Specific TF [Penicillium subrubescens]KAJ5886901.1 transcriptional regulator family: Fungal Specific TF [Penicillium subrubescens]
MSWISTIRRNYSPTTTPDSKELAIERSSLLSLVLDVIWSPPSSRHDGPRSVVCHELPARARRAALAKRSVTKHSLAHIVPVRFTDGDDKAVRPSPWPVSQSNTHTSSHTRALESSHPPDRSLKNTSRGPYLPEPQTPIPDTPTASSIHNDETPTAPSEIGDAASRDGLSGVNLHTKGTEFYGNSSNLAFLGNLYTRAKNQAETRAAELQATESDTPASTSRQQPLSPAAGPRTGPLSGKAQLSIVNLLYNADYTGHPSPHSITGVESGTNRSPSFVVGQGHAGALNNSQDINLPAIFSKISSTAQLEIEKIFIGSYFTNKHYIHPILSKGSFMRRCEREAWPISKRPTLFRGTVKFASLYFAVVALGAINASPNETALLDHFCHQSEDPDKTLPPETRFSALDFAKFYFDIAKQALGDLFESSCLETAQALFLMSVFRQNSLQPHSCYMYSGMAVRTAAAIGLASGMSGLPSVMRKEAKRTWWCIYSHEIEMCCSSGRLDSMKELHYYQVSLPKLKVNVGTLDPDAEDNDIAMIPTMVSLAQIMSEASHQLYHATKRSISENSRLAMDLDARLLEWKANIPSFLNPEATTLNDPEWAFKQKLVLRLRYYNTRILLHRPFLVSATSNTKSRELRHHLHICLEAARKSITMQYESFMHRIYIRTWWYNTTYALYGSMILLHLILSNYPSLPDDDLLEDVEKSLEIFESMDDIIVARRCAEMLREVLDVARTCLARRRRGENGNAGLVDGRGCESGSGGSSTAASTTGASLTGMGTGMNIDLQQQPGYAGAPTLSIENMASSSSQNDASEEDFFFSFFSQDPHQPPDRTRTEMLANLVDPSILEDFAFGGQELSFF